MSRRVDIAIIGAGFSGLLLAFHLLRSGADLRIYLIERASFGRGLAYSSNDPADLLNVRACNMSALAEEPDHFVRWLECKTGIGEPFVSRHLYGTYLQELLRSSVGSEAASGRLQIVPDEAMGLVGGDGGRTIVRLGLGNRIEVDQVVLATGNLPGRDPRGLDDEVRLSDAYVRDPWSPDAFRTLRPEDDVMLIGSGLTSMDLALKLSRRGHVGRIVALSRRGLKPHAHTDCGALPDGYDVPVRPSLTTLVRLVRRRAATGDWRAAVDGLRPTIQRLWREATPVQRRRFLRHLRPWWDIHRHRLAPPVAAAIAALQASGQMEIRAGRILDLRKRSGRIAVSYRSRHGQDMQQLIVDRVLNCTGPAGDVGKTRSPLLADLVARGMARADACGLGIEIDADCRVVGLDGTAVANLLAVGPMSRGAFWEIIAVPDIRVQALVLAERLAAESVRRLAEAV